MFKQLLVGAVALSPVLALLAPVNAVPVTPGIPQAGLLTEFHTDFGNPGNGAALDAHFNSHPGGSVGTFVAPNIDRDNDVFYPSDGVANGGRDNFSVRYRGFINITPDLVGQTIIFRDFTDDYARLIIDGDILIDDNDWTDYNGGANGGGGVASKIFSLSGYHSFEFIMAEGGGGDNARLLWNVNPTGLGPNGEFAVIPQSSFQTIVVPEPATIGLGILGFTALASRFGRRRRNA